MKQSILSVVLVCLVIPFASNADRNHYDRDGGRRYDNDRGRGRPQGNSYEVFRLQREIYELREENSRYSLCVSGLNRKVKALSSEMYNLAVASQVDGDSFSAERIRRNAENLAFEISSNCRFPENN